MRVDVKVDTFARTGRSIPDAVLTYETGDLDVSPGDRVLVLVSGMKYIGTVLDSEPTYLHSANHILEIVETAAPLVIV